MEKKFLDTYNRCVSTWGVDSEIRQCVEEMAELTKELMKYFRYGGENCPKQVKDHIIEEIADVQNMVDSMQNIFGEKLVDEIRSQKIERVKRELDEEQN